MNTPTVSTALFVIQSVDLSDLSSQSGYDALPFSTVRLAQPRADGVLNRIRDVTRVLSWVSREFAH